MFCISYFLGYCVEVDIVPFENRLCFFLERVGVFIDLGEVLKHNSDSEIEDEK